MTREIKFGLFLPTGDFAKAKQAALDAEARGFYSVSINDHFFTPLGQPQTPQLECFTTLTAIAAVTSKVRLAPSVAAVSFRSPPMLAKIATTLDHVSNGRLILGLGAGWKRDEYEAHGYPYGTNPERLAQLAEAIKVLKAMWTQDAPTHHGRYFNIDKAYNNPRPVQHPYPPFMIGGSGSGLLRIAAVEANIINIIPPIFNGQDFVNDPAAAVKFDKPELKRRIAMLHRYAQEAGRNPGEIEISGLVIVSMSRNPADPAMQATAASVGFTDQTVARNSPVMLMGTPEQVKNELQARIKETGMTYFIVLPVSEESHELFTQEVMPAFAH